MARPIPRDPPVTNATLPDNEDIDPNPQVIECHYNTPRVMTTACIIGAGELGGAVAHALARGERVGRVVLIDAAGGVAAGKALDIQQSGAVEGFHTQLAGTDDLTRVTGCDVCVVADRTGSAGEWRGEEAQAMMTRLAPYLAATPTVFAGPSQGDVIAALVREGGARRERLIGSAPVAYAAAVTAIVAMEARCAPGEVNLTVLGAPAGFVIPWSEASIGGYALESVLSQVQLTRLDARVARLWPPGPYALGLAAARVAEAILTSSRRAFSVLTMLGGEFGVRGRVGALPAMLSTTGIVHTRVPTLNTRERVQLETALGV
jgi:malate dehydrogenase